MNTQIRIQAIVVALILLVVAVMAVFLGDRSFQWWQDTQSQHTLQEMAQQGEATVRHEIDSLQTLVADLKTQASLSQRRQAPSPETIRNLADNHHIEIRQLERINPVTTTRGGSLGYRVTLLGTVGRVLRFCHDFEHRFTADLRQAVLQAANADGSRVMLILHMEVQEE